MRIRTGYSFRSAFGHLEDVIDRIETPWAPITDRAATFGFNNWTKLCKKRGKRPLYGVELAVSPEMTAKKVTRSHFTFVATNSLRSINRLLFEASGNFRYEPLLAYDYVNNVNDGLIVIPGRNAILERLRPEQIPGLNVILSPSTPHRMIEWAKEKGVPLIAGSDNYYPAADDRDAYEVLCGRGATTQTYPMHILSLAEQIRYAGREAVGLAERLAERCSVELSPAALLTPEKPQSLAQMCINGAIRLGCNIARPEYAARLARELELIDEKQYEDYFYIIADLVDYAKSVMFVGPARGSSCGSLVCYLLGITTIDPIPYGLVFERFIDINRMDLPDIDIDFSEQNRHKAFKYLEQKYGKRRVARLGTVARYKPTSAINEAGAALGVPKWRVTQFTSAILERASADSRALQAIEDTFNDTPVGRKLLEDFPELIIAQKMEGHPRHYSQHAAGVVVTQEPIEEYVALDSRSNAMHCDKKDAEDLNLLKIDCLGLIQLSIFEDCLAMIGKDKDWLINYPTDDAKAFQVLNDHKWSGIFQFMGQALQAITQYVTVTEIEDIIAITALARPGPLASGGTQKWIDRKNGKDKITYLTPVFEEILKTSLGIVVYQEQVMQLGRQIGGFSWDEVTVLRKAMSKSMGAEFFDKSGKQFVEGAMERGIERGIAMEVWKGLCQYGSWAFNRSHSVAYGLISYWCCVLKAHFPLEFAAATLQHLDEPDKQLKMLREMVKEGYTYTPVDAELSDDKWRAVNGRLIGPITNIKGLGPKLLAETIEARRRGEEIPKRVQKMLQNPITNIDQLEPVATRFAELYPAGREAIGIATAPTPICNIQCETLGGREVVVIGKIIDIMPRDMNELTNVAKRGYEIKGSDTAYLNIVIEDDTDQIRATIWARNFPQIGQPIINEGDAGNVLYVIKGKLGKNFRGIDIERAKFLGKMK